jgi:hypothetical protein
MKTTWTKGLSDQQDADEVRASFKSAKLLRLRLAEILETKMSEKERTSLDAEGYDCPNWAYKMADLQGYKRALAEIISLISEK